MSSRLRRKEWLRRPGIRLAAGALAVLPAVLVAELPVMAGDLQAGRDKASACQTCHGIDGIAKVPDAPNLAGESELYLVSQLKAFRSGQRQHAIMSVIAENLSDEDISDLAAWYSSIEIQVTLPE